MRRTLLAVGIAVLVSMLLVPHWTGWRVARLWGDYYGWWTWYPLFWPDRNDYYSVKWSGFFTQTAFVVLLAAVLVNLRESWRRKPKPPPASS